MPFVAGDDIHLVAFDDAFELWRWFELNHAGAQVDGHLMDIIFVQVKFLRDLLV